MKDGEQICNKCNGRGYHALTRRNMLDLKKIEFYKECCPICKGSGYITWLENIFGVTRECQDSRWEPYE